MRISSVVSFLGFVLIIAGTYCPLLRPFGLFSWDMYALNKPYGIVVLIMAIAGIAGLILQQKSLAKVASFIVLVLVILLFAAALFKVNTTFSFIPFKGMASGLTHLIKFKWGWYLLFTGAILSVVGTVSNKRIIVPAQ